MIKKITNWTFGSVFRTIGRFIAYILIGIIISLFFIKKDYVKADTWNTYEMRDVTCQIDTVNWNCATVNFYTYIEWGQSLDPHRFVYNFNNINLNNTANTMYVTASIYPNTLLGWSEEQSFTANGNTIAYSRGSDFYRFVVNLTYKDNNNVEHACIMDNASFPNVVFKCPVSTTKSVKQFYIEYVGLAPMDFIGNPDIRIGIYRIIQVMNSSSESIINNQNQNYNNQMNYFNSTISGEVNGTGTNGTITDEDAQSNSCGIICKLKHLINMLSIDNIKYIVVPTEEQMNDLFSQMQEKITSKLGILGLPVTVYTRLMQIAMQYDDQQQNWCLQWNGVQVPNFEEHEIIQAGQWCFSDILQNEKINTFRTICISIIGGLILLSFIQYLYNCLHRILDVPVRDNYEYFTTEDVYGINTETGEVESHQIRNRTTIRR